MSDADDIDDTEREAAKKQAQQDARKMKTYALDGEDKMHCQNIAVYGPSYLIGLGWKLKKITAFLERNDVIAELRLLQGQYVDREGIQERTQFFAQMKINQMVPKAINILARSLMGTQIDENGKIKSRPPERIQIDAALEVLNRSNVQGTKFKGNDKTPSIDAREINIYGNIEEKTKNLTPQQRDRLRKIYNKLQAAQKAEEQIDQRIEHAKTVEATTHNDDENDE